MKRKCIFATVALMFTGAAAFAQEAPPGAGATRCDVSQFTPVVSERTGDVLYWNNPTCPAGVGATDRAAAAVTLVSAPDTGDDTGKGKDKGKGKGKDKGKDKGKGNS